VDFKVDLEGRVAVVTGAAGDIGRAVAVLLAKSGAAVAVTDTHERADSIARIAAEINAFKGKAIASAADIAIRTDIDQLLGEVLNEFGAVDLLINVAGACTGDSISSIDELKWDEIMKVNLKGPFIACQAFSKVMSQQGSGNIINIAMDSSVNLVAGDGPNACSMSCLASLTQHLARELGGDGVRANVIAHGWVKAEQLDADIPSDCTAEADDIAYIALFLASEASRCITGQLIFADGGRF